jgi:2-methylcitrate dehydratase
VMDKIKVIANEEFDDMFPQSQPSRVSIVTRDGRKLSKRVDVPKGDPRDPMTEQEIGVKAMAMGKGVVGEAKVKALGEWVMKLEEAPKVDKLFELMKA